MAWPMANEQPEKPAGTDEPVTQSQAPLVILRPTVKLVFLSVLALTILSLAVSISLAVMFPSPSDQIRGLIEMCSTTYKMGFGAVVGLIGGKAI